MGWRSLLGLGASSEEVKSDPVPSSVQNLRVALTRSLEAVTLPPGLTSLKTIRDKYPAAGKRDGWGRLSMGTTEPGWEFRFHQNIMSGVQIDGKHREILGGHRDQTKPREGDSS